MGDTICAVARVGQSEPATLSRFTLRNRPNRTGRPPSRGRAGSAPTQVNTSCNEPRGATTPRHWVPGCARSAAAGPVAARRRGEVARPLEGGRGRLVRARRPRGDGSAAGRARRLLRRPGQPSCCLSGAVAPAASRPAKIVINLERLHELPAEDAGPLVALRRADPEPARRLQRPGAVDPHEDLRSLAIIYD